MDFQFFNRDISWLSFNERVLMEAGKEMVPIGDRLNFLAIYSSNLDEFYRVRVPAVMGLHKVGKEKEISDIPEKIESIVNRQQNLYGITLKSLLPLLLEKHHINLVYGEKIPAEIHSHVKEYFFNQVMTFLQPVFLSEKTDFFPENNKIYHAVLVEKKGKTDMVVINIPSGSLSRFYSVSVDGMKHIIFLDDIIAENVKYLFPDSVVHDCHSFKITRDAELDLEDEYEQDLAKEIEKQLLKRDMGLATRFLYDANMPEADLNFLVNSLKLKKANIVVGGRYHNLKDFFKLPLQGDPFLFYDKFLPVHYNITSTIFEQMAESDFVIHPPYHSYETVLRFFNEAAQDEKTTGIYITLYRVAHDSHIAHALISAAKNGKKVTVFVELKARFDEANNIRWAKEMKDAGAKIIYSIPGLKVHAKVALVKRKEEGRMIYYGLLATGNFNEKTARIYSDHVLFTTHKKMLRELELVFLLFNYRKNNLKGSLPVLKFNHLVISKFNMMEKFSELIDEEIVQAREGKTAGITIQLNNLEEPILISKLYEASCAGVQIRLIIRGILRLIPGVKGMSENIIVRRIVDRFLEHGRIFIFHHKGEELIFTGSSDWMTRNIFHRIEVCFPVYDSKIKKQFKDIINLSLADNVEAVNVDENLNNVPVPHRDPSVRAQSAIYEYIKSLK